MTVYELAKKFNQLDLENYLSIIVQHDEISVQIKVGTCYSRNYVNSISWKDDKDLDVKYNEVIESIKSLFHYTCIHDFHNTETGYKGTPYSDAIAKLISMER